MRLLVLSLVLCCCCCCCAAETIEVSLSGEIQNLTAAAKVAKPGDVIEIRGGVYFGAQPIERLNGTAEQPIVVRPRAGESVVFDGSTLPSGSTVCKWSRLTHVHVEGPIEVRSCPRVCVEVWFANHLTLGPGLVLHDSQMWALITRGRDVLVFGNEFYDCVLHNVNGSSRDAGTGWMQCCASSAYDYAGLELSERIVWENNFIHDSWGESLDIILCDGCVARGNRIDNGWSVLLYADNVRNVVIENNVISQTNTSFNLYPLVPAHCIAMATESWPSHPIPVENVTVRNNLCVSAGPGVSYWSASENLNYYSDIHIHHNTFWNTRGMGIKFSASNTSGVSRNNQILNNVFYIVWQTQIARLSLPSADAGSWEINANVWVGVASVGLNDTELPSKSIAVESRKEPSLLFTSQCNVTATSQSNCWEPSCFAPAEDGVLAKGGVPIASNSPSRDFFGCLRSKSVPSIGFAESGACSFSEDASADGDGSGSDIDTATRNLISYNCWALLLLEVIIVKQAA